MARFLAREVWFVCASDMHVADGLRIGTSYPRVVLEGGIEEGEKRYLCSVHAKNVRVSNSGTLAVSAAGSVELSAKVCFALASHADALYQGELALLITRNRGANSLQGC